MARRGGGARAPLTPAAFAGDPLRGAGARGCASSLGAPVLALRGRRGRGNERRIRPVAATTGDFVAVAAEAPRAEATRTRRGIAPRTPVRLATGGRREARSARRRSPPPLAVGHSRVAARIPPRSTTPASPSARAVPAGGGGARSARGASQPGPQARGPSTPSEPRPAARTASRGAARQPGAAAHGSAERRRPGRYCSSTGRLCPRTGPRSTPDSRRRPGTAPGRGRSSGSGRRRRPSPTAQACFT